MFEHFVKVPRHYKVAANIIKKVSTEGGSVKTLLYDNKLRHFRTNVLFALITETIKHATDIDKIFKNFNVLETESRLDPWLAKVLTTELLYGKKALPGQSRPEQTILAYKEKFETYISEHQDNLLTEATPRRPRYVRINTILLTTSDAIRAFQDEGYRFIRCTSGSYEDYLEQIQNLTEDDFTQDYHVKTIFVFASGTKLHEHQLYLENKIILQDKATALAVHLLAPPVGSVILDMCAAPGMKTTQLAAYIRNNGKIYAVERNEKRYQTLCDFVAKTGSSCVRTLHMDTLEIKRGDYDDVEYILLDPSCSGSGMDFCVHNYIEDTRLAKLTSLQEKFLKHAMNAFPKVKRIVYSTCSLFPEENERVITNVVKTSRAKWRVQDVKELLKGQWKNFGSAMYGSMGTRCMYAKPENDFTTGFFLAVLDRDPKDLEKRNETGEISRNVDRKKEVNIKVNDVDAETSNLFVDNVEHSEMETEMISKKKKKKKKKPEEVLEDMGVMSYDENEGNTPNKRHTLKHKLSETIENQEDMVECSEIPKKKKKKSLDNTLVTSLAENFNELVVENNVVENVPKMKKKKNKKKDKNEECIEKENAETTSILSESPVDEIIENVSKKKKRKIKHNDVEEELNETEYSVKKKKSKKLS